MQDALRHMENIYSEMLGISEFIRMIYNRYLQLELLELREELRMTDMLNNKMYLISKEYRSDNYSHILFLARGSWQSLNAELDKNK